MAPVLLPSRWLRIYGCFLGWGEGFLWADGLFLGLAYKLLAGLVLSLVGHFFGFLVDFVWESGYSISSSTYIWLLFSAPRARSAFFDQPFWLHGYHRIADRLVWVEVSCGH